MDEARSAPLARLLLDAFTWFDSALTAGLAHQGGPTLTRTQSLVMSQISDTGSRSSEIARNLGVTRQAVHQTVAELERLGLVRMAADPTNASAKLVHLTRSGTRSVHAALALFDELELTLRARIGDRRFAALRSALSADWGPAPLPDAQRAPDS